MSTLTHRENLFHCQNLLLSHSFSKRVLTIWMCKVVHVRHLAPWEHERNYFPGISLTIISSFTFILQQPCGALSGGCHRHRTREVWRENPICLHCSHASWVAPMLWWQRRTWGERGGALIELVFKLACCRTFNVCTLFILWSCVSKYFTYIFINMSFMFMVVLNLTFTWWRCYSMILGV